MLERGQYGFFEEFLGNVKAAGVSHCITPFPMTSTNAARIFAEKGMQFDLVYIDASHEYVDVLSDLRPRRPSARLQWRRRAADALQPARTHAERCCSPASRSSVAECCCSRALGAVRVRLPGMLHGAAVAAEPTCLVHTSSTPP